jgi:hypothetical protein
VLLVPEGDSSRRRHAHTECVLAARREGRLPTKAEWQRNAPQPRGQSRRGESRPRGWWRRGESRPRGWWRRAIDQIRGGGR